MQEHKDEKEEEENTDKDEEGSSRLTYILKIAPQKRLHKCECPRKGNWSTSRPLICQLSTPSSLIEKITKKTQSAADISNRGRTCWVHARSRLGDNLIEESSSSNAFFQVQAKSPEIFFSGASLRTSHGRMTHGSEKVPT
jgi:hypothetical protein